MAARRLSRGRPASRPDAWVSPANNVAEVYRRNLSNLTAEEHERLNYMAGPQGGMLPPEFFDAKSALESFGGGECYIDEVRAQLLSEDWMQGELDDLDTSINSMRKGDRKDELIEILKRIRSVREEAVQAMEYAADQLDKLSEAIGKLT